jgi:hypothetical protein
MWYLFIACYAWAAVGCFAFGMLVNWKFAALGHRPPSIAKTAFVAAVWPLAAFIQVLHMCVYAVSVNLDQE